ncbi:MAG: type II toxin-antitoxin system HicA family toxin [Chloroflexia bacterium]
MPRKIRQIEADYLRNGFWLVSAGGKGSHRKFRHELLPGSYGLSGNAGDDVKPYQEADLRRALRDLSEARTRGQQG